MNKKNILLITLAVALAGFLVVKEYIDNNKKKKNEPTRTAQDIEPLKMSEPTPAENEQKITVKSSAAVTFLLTQHDVIYYYTGRFNGILNKTNYTKVGEIIKKYNSTIDPKELIFVIKTDNNSSFKNTVDLLDEMVSCKVAAGHYVETAATKEEIECIKKYNDQ